MLTVLYTFFIAPLEALMTAVLGAAHDLIGSYGWSVAVMSLVVNTLILPIYNKAESWQEEERRIKKGFESTEAMIKRTFKGQERFAMLTTMRRQHGYSARLALRSSLGFFLQIPFFIAAYHLLSNMPELRGVAFGPITDLGAADGLIKLGGFSINVLPLLMTAVNLLSAFVYTASLSKQDKIQLYGLSALFLILLYASPAALTLYWTLNNVYSLGKNFIQKRQIKFQRKEKNTEKALCISDGDTQRTRKISWLAGNLSSLFLVLFSLGVWREIAKVEEGQQFVADLSVNRLSLLMGLLALGLLLGFEVIARSLKVRLSVKLLWVCRGTTIAHLLMVIVLVFWGRDLVSEWAFNPLVRPELVDLMLNVSFALLSLLVFVYLFWLVDLKWLTVRYLDSMRGATQALASLLLFVVLVCSPLFLYVSDPEEVAVSWQAIVPPLMLYWFVATSILVLGVRKMPENGVALSYVLALLLFFVVISYTFVFVGDYGLINGGVLEHESALYFRGINWLKDLLIFALLGCCVVWVYKRLSPTMVNQLAISMFLCFSFLLMVLFSGVPTSIKRVDSESGGLPKTSDSYLFSLSGKNLVVVVLDMFTGDHFAELMRREPRLMHGLQGFTWYQDTLSAGNSTVFSLPSVVGGDAFSPHKINESANSHAESLLDRYERSYDVIPSLLGEEWDSAVLGSNWRRKREGPAYLNVSHQQMRDDWFGYFYKDKISDWDSKSRTRVVEDLISYSVFRASPYSIRRKVYKNGRWLFRERETLRSFESYAAFRSWIEFSKVVLGGNFYRHYYTDITHVGEWFDLNGQPSLLKEITPTAWKETQGVLEYSHYLAEKAAVEQLVSWFEWMRKENVFDNTRIVVVSDHGGRDSVWLMQGLGMVPRAGRMLEEGVEVPGVQYPLLLVKDFDSKGDLRISSNRMMNSDALPLLLSGIVDLHGSDLQNPQRVRYYDSCRDADLMSNRLKCLKYEVNGPINRKASWRLIEDNR